MYANFGDIKRANRSEVSISDSILLKKHTNILYNDNSQTFCSVCLCWYGAKFTYVEKKYGYMDLDEYISNNIPKDPCAYNWNTVEHISSILKENK